ncbi:MAG: DUF4184 family protein [Terracidiphilus sp.]
MPFTLAHAAAAYPLRRTRLILSAVIIGTFAPDLEFFLRFGPRGPFGHTARGFFLLSMPAAFMMYWIFHEVVKEPLAALLPCAARQRISLGSCVLSFRKPLQLLLVLVSLLIGGATHILWDSFTHASYWPGRHIPELRDAVTLPLVGVVHYYKLFQYGSTVFGLVVVALWFLHWVRTAPIQPEPAGKGIPVSHVRIARVLIPATALLGAFLRAVLDARHLDTPRGIEIWVGDFVVAAISMAWVELMIWGFTLPPPRPSLAAPAPGSIK